MVEKNGLSSLSQIVDLKDDKASRRDVMPPDLASKGTTAEKQDELRTLDETRLSNSRNEVDKFNNLCDGVLTAYSMFETCSTQIMAIKDELLKHALPSNLLVNLTLTCSRLYRSACDLSVPTNELVRLVRLYSAEWEEKSNVLKKLHEDYESKQRRLDLALKKLELVGVASERIEKEKRIMNWEKIFSKVMTTKSHGHRWKFLISSLKEKVQSGEILSIPFPSNTTDEEPSDEKKTETYVPRHHRKNIKSLRHQSLLRREARNSRDTRTGDEQHEEDNEEESELSSAEDHQGKHATDRLRKSENNSETRLSFASSRFKSKYPFEVEEFPRRLKTERTETPTGMRRINSPRATTPVRRLTPRNSADVLSVGKKNVSFFDESSEANQTIVCVKEDKGVWTGETQYDRFLHVRVYKPECAKAPGPICTVCFGDQVFNGCVYEINEDTDGSTALPASEGNAIKSPSEASPENINFQEFVFTLPDGKVFEKGKSVLDITSQQLRIAVQPGKGEQMVAMCTVEYSALKILEERNLIAKDLDINTTENHPLLSLLADKQTMFNSVVGHVPLVCYQSKKERALTRDQSTQTLSIQELFDEIMEIKRIEEEEESKLKHDEPAKMFSETEFREMEQKHTEELECLRKEYEMQLEEIVRASKSDTSDRLSHHQLESKFVSACTSPISMELMSPLPSSPMTRPRTADARSSPRKGRKVKTSQNLPEWGKDLPANFFDRLDQFSRASAKHRQELSEKTKKAVQENYELQMATQNKLDLITDDNIDLNDVCLPALFMPSRMGTVYSPKASLYFHPSGISKSRFTQPPSVFKLHCATERDCSSVMNLFDLSQTFLTSGPTLSHQNRRPRSASSAVPQKKSLSISTSLDTHEQHTN